MVNWVLSDECERVSVFHYQLSFRLHKSRTTVLSAPFSIFLSNFHTVQKFCPHLPLLIKQKHSGGEIMRYSSSSHTRFYYRFHVVWVTKYRYKVLQGAMRERICQIIIQICDKMGVHIACGVLAGDLVDMFLSIPPKRSLSDVSQRIKGRLSRRIRMEFPELRKRYWGRRF